MRKNRNLRTQQVSSSMDKLEGLHRLILQQLYIMKISFLVPSKADEDWGTLLKRPRLSHFNQASGD